MKKLLKLIAVGVVLVVCYSALTKGKNNDETVRTPSTAGAVYSSRTRGTTTRR